MHSLNNYSNKIYKYIIKIQVVLLCFSFSALHSQDQQEIQIANEYVLKGEKQKALELYESLAKKNQNIPSIHSNYLSLLLDFGKNSEAENYVEKLIRKDDRFTYKLDLGIVYIRSGDVAKGDKYLKSFIKSQTVDIYRIKSIADYMATRNFFDYSVYALQQCRADQQNPTLFVLELANFYRMQGKRDEMVEEYLRYVMQSPANISYVKNLMQVLLTKPEELESLEKILYERVQKDQDSETLADLLIWVNLQQKNFYGAFIQARSFDKRFKPENSKTLEIGQIAINNQDYDNAEKCFQFVIKDFANSENYFPARLGLIHAREAKVKRNFPVNRDSVRYLLSEYHQFVKRYPEQPSSYDAILSEANLHAYYMDEKDSAIQELTALIQNNRVAPYTKAKAKIDLGDIYVLNEQPWESTLLYSQVEKTQRETSLGYEAKLRNAKLSYYKGDFLLAQEHLDILKQATTREIANDAMELSMRIKENTSFDTTGAALKEYASIELLLYQNKLKEALDRIEKFKGEKIITDLAEAFELNRRVGDTLRTYPYSNQAILDDVYWLEANLRLKMREYTTAINLLTKIEKEFGDDILADDADFLKAEIYDRYLKNKEEAMNTYRTFLDKFPGSVYAAEARKRYRALRGDFVLPAN